MKAYAAIFRTPRVGVLLAATVLARLPIGINRSRSPTRRWSWPFS